MQGTVRPIRKSSLLQNLKPERSAAYRQLVHGPVTLTDRPYQAEISDRSFARLQIAFKNNHTLSEARCVIGVRQAENSRTNDGDVCSLFHPITGIGALHRRITEGLLECKNELHTPGLESAPKFRVFCTLVVFLVPQLADARFRRGGFGVLEGRNIGSRDRDFLTTYPSIATR